MTRVEAGPAAFSVSPFAERKATLLYGQLMLPGKRVI